MSFLQPAMLWFAGLASVPVLIYLFHRQRYTVLPWAAMAFVRRALHRNRRRMKIENWLLLALRVLAVLLLVAAVARPVLRSRALAGDTEGGVRNVVIALDTSFSMAQRHGARTAFDRALEGAQQLAAHRVREGDRVALVRLGADAEPVYAEPQFVDAQQRARLIADSAAQRPSYRPGDMPRALRGLLGLLPRFRLAKDGSPPPAEIHVFTDLQRSSWRGADGRWLDPDLPATVEALRRAGARVTLIDCGAPERANAAITDLGLEEPVAVLDAPLRFFVELWAAGTQPLEGLSLELQIDGQLVRSLPVSLEAGERARFTVIGTVGEPGVHHARATLRGDELEVDSVRDFAFEVREGVSVLVVDGEPGDEPWEGETDFLLAALAPEPGAHLQGDDIFAPRRITEAQLADEKLEGVDVIVLANVIAIGARQAERIERWVREGGGLLFATGDQVDPRVWNELWWRDGQGPLPAQLGPTVRSPDEESYFVLEPLVFSHPALAPFAPREMRTLLTEPRWVAYTRLVSGEPAGDRTVLARFAPRRLTEAGGLEASSAGRAQDPALVQRRVGRGEVVLYASALDAAWSNFYYKPGYVILWRRLLATLAAAGAPRRNLRVGEPFERTIAARDYVPEVTLITPDEDRVDKTLEPIDEARSEFRLVHEDTARPGFYRIEFRSRTAAATGERARKRGDGFAVHVDPRRESVLDAIDTDTLRTVLVPEVFEIRSLETAGAGPGAAVRGEAEGEISRGLLLAVMGLLFGESALGCWFGRRAAR